MFPLSSDLSLYVLIFVFTVVLFNLIVFTIIVCCGDPTDVTFSTAPLAISPIAQQDWGREFFTGVSECREARASATFDVRRVILEGEDEEVSRAELAVRVRLRILSH